MASRRPVSAQAKLRNAATQSTKITRAQSALAKRTFTDTDSASNPTLADKSGPSFQSSSFALKPVGHFDNAETNIRVIIRCRGRSEREISEHSPLIVRLDGTKTKEVVIETSVPTSTLGVVTLPPERIYPFDLVFGPEADQLLIYDEVVSPMLKEVLEGYNCTLFAYGQTGTGKTYTMQGDLTATPLGAPSMNAGMMPRVLYRLFYQLDSSGVDYSVKISFIELYNEELRDLLATDFTPPAGSAQPMGKGSNTGDGGLKMFDDAARRGVVIQNLEEVPVKSYEDALVLLARGSQRRQVGATNLNFHSSRSHSVFSVTAHIREPSSVGGEDLLKVGKLNLVDLAGSENIGRSGAENMRAREAGMINQSLLTLGRVINALVDKAQHVPYRESKLTRLLQDSLGGRTKTCIIATISPARSNLEETLSTLDYALRAKSIRNKPEVNQRMTRNSLLKEYVTQIEQLKADLLATREKNGIFVAEETWNRMTREQELHNTDLEEGKKHIEIAESRLKHLRQEFDQSIAVIRKREGELKEVREQLQTATQALDQQTVELQLIQADLEEETIIRKAHQETEITLDGVAQDLRSVVHRSLRDVDGLFQKIDRQSKVLSVNKKVTTSESGKISSTASTLTRALEEFVNTAAEAISRLQNEANQIKGDELQTLDAQTKHIELHLDALQRSVEEIHSHEKTESTSIEEIQFLVNGTHASFVQSFETWTQQLRSMMQIVCSKLTTQSSEGLGNAENALESMIGLIDTLSQDLNGYLIHEKKDLNWLMTLANQAAMTEIARLNQQNERLVQLLEDEKSVALQAQNDLVRRVSGLLCDFVDERDRNLRGVLNLIIDDNQKAQQDVQSFSAQHQGRVIALEERNGEIASFLHDRTNEAKRTRDGNLKALSSSKIAMMSSLQELDNNYISATQQYSKRIQEESTSRLAAYSNAHEEYSRAKRARIEVTDSIVDGTQSSYSHLHEKGLSKRNNLLSHFSHISTNTSELSSLVHSHGDNLGKEISTVQVASTNIFEKGAQDVISTNMTPRKRQWSFTDEWSLTKNREEVLRSRKVKPIPRPSSPGPATTPAVASFDESRPDALQYPDTPADDRESTSTESLLEHKSPAPSTSSPGVSVASIAMPPPPVPLEHPAPMKRLQKRVHSRNGLPGSLVDSHTFNTQVTQRSRRGR